MSDAIPLVELFAGEDLQFARAVSALVFCNPFLPERLDWERRALGDRFEDKGAVWHSRAGIEPQDNRNVQRLEERTLHLIEEARGRLAAGPSRVDPQQKSLYEDLVVYALYYRYEGPLYRVLAGRDRCAAYFYGDFRDDLHRYLDPLPGPPRRGLDPAHLFACFFQLRRAFHLIFHYILGGSLPAAHLRAAAWESIFTHDIRRYRRSFWARMGDVPTLITGPSGTGKELVARAVTLARYVPFEVGSMCFAVDYEELFQALNLSALSPTLIESELFGHRRGSFTGAVQDRAGWLEVCSPLGSVFPRRDRRGGAGNPGQIASGPAVQVSSSGWGSRRIAVSKARSWRRRTGTSRPRCEPDGCGRTSSTACRRTGSKPRRSRPNSPDTEGELSRLIEILACRFVGEEEGTGLAGETHAWIEKELPEGYSWPGNVRELEQCLRSVLVRGRYLPAGQPADPIEALVERIRGGHDDQRGAGVPSRHGRLCPHRELRGDRTSARSRPADRQGQARSSPVGTAAGAQADSPEKRPAPGGRTAVD